MKNLIEISGLYEYYEGVKWRLIQGSYEPKPRDLVLISCKGLNQVNVFKVTKVDKHDIIIRSVLEGDSVVPNERKQSFTISRNLLPCLNFYVAL